MLCAIRGQSRRFKFWGLGVSQDYLDLRRRLSPVVRWSAPAAIALAVSAAAIAPSAQAQAPAGSPLAQSAEPSTELSPASLDKAKTLTVGIKAFDPFVFVPENSEQNPYGFSIDLWNEIAEKQDLKTRFVTYASVPELLGAVEAGEVDAAIAALSITSDRLAGNLRFSYPYYQSGLQLMVNRDQGPSLQGFLGFLGNWTSLRSVVLVLGSCALVGVLVWVFEHPHNEHFPKKPVTGIGQGVWFAIVTLGTFGYGDVTPLGLPARIVTVIWMGISFFIVADFISSMTVREIASSVGGLDDLRGETIGVVANTTAETFLRSQPVESSAYPTFEAAAAALANHEVAGVVRDYPEVQYFISRNPEFEAVGDRLTREDYGIAVAADNLALLEEVDYALVRLQEQDVLRSLDAKWFGLEVASGEK